MTTGDPARRGDGRRGPGRRPIRTVILVAPFGLISFPDIGVSSIKAVFARNGLPLDVEYINLDFARRIGVRSYQFLANNCNPFLVSEYPFATELNPALPSFRQFAREVLPPAAGGPPGSARSYYDGVLQCMDGIVSKVGAYLDDVERNLDLSCYDVVGLTSSYAQNSACWAIARRLRRRWPDRTFVIGGANCDGEMGQAHVDAWDFIDYACTGEGERSFLELVRWLEEPSANEFPESGIVSRGRRGGAEPQRLVDVRTLPVPDYDDYFRAIERQPHWRKWYYGLPLESSRGCWWGEKRQCVFCGCNGTRLAFREKPAGQFLGELREVRARYGERAKYVQVVDNIMPHGYLGSFLPLVREERPYEALFYEIKANLKPDQIARLADSGIRFLQPGVESLSTPVLALMGKGTTAIANVQTLKFATERGVWLIWAILCGIPGEEPEHYERMAELLPKLYHLNPPKGIHKVTIDRHSPLHREPARYGLRLEPARAYRRLYSLPEAIVDDLAYWFEDANSGGGRTDYYELPQYAKTCQRRIRIWQASFLRSRDARLDYESDGEQLRLVDTRSGAAQDVVLNGLKKAVAEATAQVATYPRIRDAVLRSHPAAEDAAVRRALEELVDASYVVREDGRYLFLGLERAALQSRQPTGFWLEKVVNNEDYTFA